MFPLSIIALNKKIFEGQVSSLTLPSKDGELTILENHIPLIAPLKKGRILLKIGDKETVFQITGGLLEVKPDSAVVLCSTM